MRLSLLSYTGLTISFSLFIFVSIFTSAQRTSWNFISLCQRGYYDETVFHRLVPGFMVQGGDPTGTGSGGESSWGKPFRDEFDSRLQHDKRGVLSMANSGQNTNGSQFFVTFQAAAHLDLVHCVFGRVVGGAATLDRIEAIGADSKERPLAEIKLIKAVVFTNPIEEADERLRSEILANISLRTESAIPSPLPPPVPIPKCLGSGAPYNASGDSLSSPLGRGIAERREAGNSSSVKRAAQTTVAAADRSVIERILKSQCAMETASFTATPEQLPPSKKARGSVEEASLRKGVPAYIHDDKKKLKGNPFNNFSSW